MAARKVHSVRRSVRRGPNALVRKGSNRIVHRGTPSKRSTIKKSIAPPKKSKSFQLIPEAHAVGPALGTAVKSGVRIVSKVKPLKGVKNMRPTRDKTIKSVTYKNVIEGPIMKKTGGGVPLYKGYDKIPPTFGVMQSGRADTRLFDLTGVKHPNVLAATRANQAMMASSPGSVKHTVKKNEFKKIIPGGPVMEFPGGTHTRYRKREVRKVITKKQLVQGQDPTTPKLGLDKFLAAPATIATVPFWDQVGDFFNPFPQAHAVGVTPLVKLAGQALQKNIKLTWNQFRQQEGITNTAANKAEFQKVKDAFAKGKQQIQTSPNFRTGKGVGAGKGDKMNRKKAWIKAGAMGGVAIGTVVGWQTGIANPELNQQFTDTMKDIETGGTTTVPPGEQSVSQKQGGAELDPNAPASVIPYGTEGGPTMQQAQDAFEEGLIVSASAAGPQPTIQYGLPNEVGKPDPNYTKMTYKKWEGGKFVEKTQWVKLGMMGGITPDNVSKLMTRQANKDKANEVHASVMKGIREHVAGVKGDKLKAAANKAKELYAVPANAAILGSLPRQYQEILNRDLTKQDAGRYGEALTWQAGKASADAEYGYTQGVPYPEGHASAGEYSITITPGGKDNPNFLKKPKDKTE